ncbi:diguanylate cyclase domain-containing protein [Methylibium petroleiphilum]|uniref:diguanylate cyclase domain-containing protein n=1 Tax=Methylibium petroleiphilum TaxID=105560 RepID=UPI002356E85E|nr:diguanylate cyclase [Methylibium petroleiphilum]
MDDEQRRVLAVGPMPPSLVATGWGAFAVDACATLDEAAARLRDGAYDAVVLNLPAAVDAQRLPVWAALTPACADAAVVVATAQPTPVLAQALIERGVQALLPSADIVTARLAPVLQQAIARKRFERSARRAYATDLATGLPNQTQLLEHVNHLLALREREPAPMALLVIRLDGLATAETTLGEAGVGVLRRKLAVRLRAALRASDVVASVGADAFAVLLAWIDAPAAAERVAAKLVRSLARPARVGSDEVAVAVAAGIGHYPEHGKDAGTLWRQAWAEAEGALPLGRAGFSNRVERGPAAAANDED